MWKMRILSKVGKLTLIKSVLNNIHIYYIHMLRKQKLIAKKIIFLNKKFIWESGDVKKGILNVKWKNI